MVQEYWYEVVDDDSLRQGDIFIDKRCHWLAEGLSPDDEAPAVDSRVSSWIIAQPSCDLDTGRLRTAILLEVVPATAARLGFRQPEPNQKEVSKRLEVVRRGLAPRRFLLPPAEYGDLTFPLSMAVWEACVVQPASYLTEHLTDGQRLRLRSPMREAFGNWVGERISAVGPENEGVIEPLYGKFSDHYVLLANGMVDE